MKTGDGETSFDELPFPVGLGDHRVDEHSGSLVAVVDENTSAHANLGGGETNPRGVIHDLEHVVHESGNGAVDVGDLAGTLGQDRVANHPDVVGNHDPKGSVPTMADPTETSAPFAHYFTGPADDLPRRPRPVEVVVDDQRLSLVSDAGVFSHGALDEGTALLIARGARPEAEFTDIADLGCGWGPIAVSLALRCPHATVWALDTNARATGLCADNARASGVTSVRSVTVDADPPLGGLDPEVTFDAIWSNPPVRIGKAALHDLLRGAFARLRPGGTAHLVVHKHLGSDSLQRWLDAEGYPTTRRLSRLGYRLLDVGPVTM